MDYNAIGQRIRSLRKRRGLSQEQLAEKIWISVTHMSHIETGSTKLSLPVLVDIANALEVGADELLGDDIHRSTEQFSDEIVGLLRSCSAREQYFLCQLLRSAKEALKSFQG